MAWAWSTVGALGVFGGIVGWTLAVLVYAASPNRRTSRRLAAVLVFEGVTTATGTGLMYLTADPVDAYAFQMVGFIIGGFGWWTYLLLLATLDSPLVRPLRTRVGEAVVLVLGLLLAGLMLAFPHLFVSGMSPAPYASWDADLTTVATSTMLLLGGGTLVFALLVSFSAYRRARSPVARRQALAFVAAFGVRDIGLLVMLLLMGTGIWSSAGAYLPPVLALVYLPLLAYGILRTQLLDLDLRLKWTVKQSTVAAVFLGVFFAVSEGAAALFEDFTGSTVVGIGAAALLVFAIAPLQRLGERVSDAAMPGVEPTPQYLAYKRMEVYRAALEGAVADGVVTEHERATLMDLREKLSIPPADAAALEVEVLKVPPAT